MIAWTKTFPSTRKPVGYLRLLRARHRYFDRLRLRRRGWRMTVDVAEGYQARLAALRNTQKGRRCFVLGNGPSLNRMDLRPLAGELTLGSNGIYKMFDAWGFHLSYLFFEDIEQTELRGHEIHAVNGPTKLAALYNAYAFKADRATLFFNAPRFKHALYYWTELYPQFSTDFANCVHLGGSITYVLLQFAYHLGCDPVYVIGVDHDYGRLPSLFKPGKITITAENIDLVRGLHVSDRYYKIGDQIGVPWVKEQEQAYRKARESFEAAGRRVYNAGVDSKLEVFDRRVFAEVIARPAGEREPSPVRAEGQR